MIRSKLISSLEKCFTYDSVDKFDALENISILKNERLSFQLIVKAAGEEPHVRFAHVRCEGALAEFTYARSVEMIPSKMPMHPAGADDNYLLSDTGLYPDLLLPLTNENRVPIAKDELRSYWITLETDGSIAGDFPLTVSLTSPDGCEKYAEHTLNVKIIDAVLPKLDFKYTQWFHGDCLATYYGCDVFSPRWWKIVENFIERASKTGINTLLTPVFTPPLDTAIGHERPTVQLVGVTKTDNGYDFDFKKLDRWLRIARKHGIEYYEISHFFTQWGAAHAPKVMATVDGEYKRIFGWETDATGEEYTEFIRSFITAFLEHMKARGEDKKCLFHISDEPHGDQIVQYSKSRNSVIDLLRGYTVMDALSEYAFYEQGIVTTPIPSNNHIKPFIEHGVKGLWTYYCCGQMKEVSNRFFAMPSYRNRCIGLQMYKYDIVGFLQWGYNFYYSQGSIEFVNPYLDSTGRYFVPSGDTYSVYPGKNGEAHESLRAAVFYDALQDMRACKLCENRIGKEKTVELIESIYGDVTFDRCPYSAKPMLEIRELINEVISHSNT